LGLAYGLLLDWARGWYCVPALMTLTLLAAGAGAAIYRLPSDPRPDSAGRCPSCPLRRLLTPLQRLAQGSLGLIIWAVALESGIVFAKEVYDQFADPSKGYTLIAAEWLAKNAEPHARIGSWHSGIIGYYAPRIDPARQITVINLDGLNNNDLLPILRSRDRLLNPYWDQIGLTALIPTLDRNKETGEVGEKMGRYKLQWDHKRLVKWCDAPGVGPPANPLDPYERVCRQRIYRIVPLSGPAESSDREPRAWSWRGLSGTTNEARTRTFDAGTRIVSAGTRIPSRPSGRGNPFPRPNRDHR
jgi:hypothetical protein